MIFNFGKILFLVYSSFIIVTLLMDNGDGPVVRADEAKPGLFCKLFKCGGNTPKPKENKKMKNGDAKEGNKDKKGKKNSDAKEGDKEKKDKKMDKKAPKKEDTPKSDQGSPEMA